MDTNQIAFGRTTWTAVDDQTAGTATATKAAVSHTSPQPAMRHVITGWSVSVDRVTSTAGKLVIKDGTTAIFSRWIPVGWYGPLVEHLTRPYACAQAAAATATITTLGTGVVCHLELEGMTISD